MGSTRRKWRRGLPGAATASVIALVLSGTITTSAAADDDDDLNLRTGSYTDWSPYQLGDDAPLRLKACGTRVRVTFPVNDYWERFRQDRFGNVYFQSKGTLKMRAIAKDGRRSRLIDISGAYAPGGLVAYTDGRFLYDALGANLLFSDPGMDTIPGMPRHFVSQGPVTVMLSPDGSPELLREPLDWVSLCALLDGARQPAGDHRTGGYTDWSPWKPDPSGDSPWFSVCGTQVRFEVEVERTRTRNRVDSLGNEYLQFKGRLTGHLVAEDGRRSELINISGQSPPGGWVFYADATETAPHVLLDMLGANLALPDPGLGVAEALPRSFVSYGPLTGVSEHNAITTLRYPERLIPGCRVLNGADVPWQ